MTQLTTLAQEAGFSHWAPINMAAVLPLAQVRDMCRADRCGQYGKNWACPPGCGTIEQIAQALKQYTGGLLVQTTGALSDAFDYQAMQTVFRQHRQRFDGFVRQIRFLYPDCLALSAGACTVCAKCTCPDKPCRFPARQLSSMEAYGLWVSDVCRRSGLPYNHGQHTITYTSCVLYTEE